jgi:hypothetical protein
MNPRAAGLGRRIRSFVENPVTNLVKGLALLTIGFSDAGRTLRDDIAHGRLRLGHGLIILGFFSLLESLGYLIESLEAGSRFLELREQEGPTKKADDP